MSNTMNTPKDALDWTKAEEDHLNVNDVVEEVEEVLKSIERIEKEVKLMKTFINQMKEIGIE